MKIAVFSDIHGNLQALEAVLGQIQGKKPDLTVFLGDIFQRGNQETECLELLKNNGIVCLKGNCELYAEHGVDIDSDVEYLRDYYDGIRAKLTPGQMQFIREMALYHETDCCGHRIRFSHFLFSDVHAAYPFLQLSSLKDGTFDRACQSGEVQKYGLVVIGHSHRNFEKGNVVSVSAAGLEGASWLLIEADGDGVAWERFPVNTELWDLYDASCQPTGETWVRGSVRPFPEGRYHIVCDILIRNVDGEYLLTQRDPCKEVHPGEWEASAGGSALAGESPLQAAEREMAEETGLTATRMELVGRSMRGSCIFYSYLAETECRREDVRLQEGETVDYRWVDKAGLVAFSHSDTGLKSHNERYREFFDQLEMEINATV